MSVRAPGEQLPLPVDFPASPGETRDSDAESFAVSLLALSNIQGIGRKTLEQLVDALDGQLFRLWRDEPEELLSLLRNIAVPNRDRVVTAIAERGDELWEQGVRQVRTLHEKGAHVIPPWSLPERLRTLPDPPRWLFVQGSTDALYFRPVVAVVGTRNASAQGKRAAEVVVKLLAAYPIALVSGLAQGIDEEAHRSSLQQGVKNVAFLGHGINLTFPAQTASLRELIIRKGGAVATEFLPNERYRREHFVLRNRLQAALADIVIPAEANSSGGTAHTIRFARKYNREIIALRFNGENQVTAELERDGYPVVNIFEQSGWRQLDQRFRALAEREGHDTFALSLVKQRLLNELRSRNVQRQDFERFIAMLRDLAEGTNWEPPSKE